jgi:hypothetical protein
MGFLIGVMIGFVFGVVMVFLVAATIGSPGGSIDE